MEKNIHDDKLDDYVRRSFEGYEEEPPADMWGRVEGDLLPAAPALRPTYLRYAWQTLAAVLILVLFSMLVCERLYYEEKIRLLTGNAAAEQQVLPDGRAKPPEKGFGGGKGEDSRTETGLRRQTVHSADAPPSESPQRMEVASALVGAQKRPAERPSDKAILSSPAPSEIALPRQTSLDMNQVPAGATNSSVDGNNKPASPEPLPAQPPRQPLRVALLPVSGGLVHFPNTALPTPALKTIHPERRPTGWYLGAESSWMALVEKSRQPLARPGRPAFPSRQENRGVTGIYWLKTGKKLNARLSLETGAGYQRTVRTATHTPRFRLGDGAHQGPTGTRRTFNYDLSTYSGTAEVSLRMDQTTPGNPLPDDEPVTLKVTTTERSALLRIPLLVGYRIGNARLQGQMKAGLLGNIVLKNEIDIAARVSQNTRFEPVTGPEGYTVRLNQNKFFLGYWTSAGAVFRLNQQFGLTAEAALTGDFPRKDPYGRRLPERLMLGVNVGANYYF